jgi:hypothetical protein
MQSSDEDVHFDSWFDQDLISASLLLARPGSLHEHIYFEGLNGATLSDGGQLARPFACKFANWFLRELDWHK